MSPPQCSKVLTTCSCRTLPAQLSPRLGSPNMRHSHSLCEMLTSECTREVVDSAGRLHVARVVVRAPHVLGGRSCDAAGPPDEGAARHLRSCRVVILELNRVKAGRYGHGAEQARANA